jgi:molybdate transport system substrate-binding protein
MRALLLAILTTASLAPALEVSAADLKLLTAGAFKSVALELVPEFEKKTGHRVTVENDTAGALARRVAAGEYFDVVVMPPGAMGPLLGGKLVESSAKPLARVGIGVAIKQGAPAPDISTVDAWKQSLLKARAIAYTDPASGGTAGNYLANLFERMGIAAALKPKTVLVKGGLAAEKLITGEADIAMQPTSELLAVPGAVVVGPIPLEVQTYIIYSGAVSTAARDQAAADALLRALWGPDKEAVLKKRGMELP